MLYSLIFEIKDKNLSLTFAKMRMMPPYLLLCPSLARLAQRIVVHTSEKRGNDEKRWRTLSMV